MVHLMKIENVGEVRNFTNGKGEQGKAIELEMSQGSNRIVCSAFDKMADVVTEKGLVKGALVWVDLRFYVSGGEKKFQSVRLNAVEIF